MQNLKVKVIGQGQLGQLMHTAGRKIGVEVLLQNPAEATDNIGGVLTTIESESAIESPAYAASQSDVINHRAHALIKDRLSQKELLSSLELPVPNWCEVSEASSLEALKDQLGEKYILKYRQGGYDGKGQAPSDEVRSLEPWRGKAIAEAMVPFEQEVSIIGARTHSGDIQFYRLSENYHHKGVLQFSVSRNNRPLWLQERCEHMLSRVMHELNYVGVMAMECFVVDDQVLINELSPRVHNSGHWTLDGAAPSQFEAHLRALLKLPLPAIEERGDQLMVNLLGLEYQTQWLETPGASLYWYQKALKPGRKMGHINISIKDQQQIKTSLKKLQLPPEYSAGSIWLEELLTEGVAKAHFCEAS